MRGAGRPKRRESPPGGCYQRPSGARLRATAIGFGDIRSAARVALPTGRHLFELRADWSQVPAALPPPPSPARCDRWRRRQQQRRRTDRRPILFIGSPAAQIAYGGLRAPLCACRRTQSRRVPARSNGNGNSNGERPKDTYKPARRDPRFLSFCRFRPLERRLRTAGHDRRGRSRGGVGDGGSHANRRAPVTI